MTTTLQEALKDVGFKESINSKKKRKLLKKEEVFRWANKPSSKKNKKNNTST